MRAGLGTNHRQGSSRTPVSVCAGPSCGGYSHVRAQRGTIRPMPKQVSNVASDDHLSAIYRLSHDAGREVIAVGVADRLGITPPSVAGMLKRLIRDGLVAQDSRKAIQLTPAGLRRAKQMVRRHRLAECLLTN